jgi:hypothetical protein
MPVLFVWVSCSPAEVSNSNQAGAKSNAGTANSSTAQPAEKTPEQKGIAFGSIEVTSKPPGARVLLIVTDESGASEPQPRGATPTTITNLSPGTYTIHVELTGYKYFQQKVEVKENSTARISAVLKKG